MITTKILPTGKVPQKLTNPEINAQTLTIIPKDIKLSNNTKTLNSSNLLKRSFHFAMDLLNKKTKHIYKNSKLIGIKEFDFKDKDGLKYFSFAKYKNNRIEYRLIFDKNTNQIKKKYTYSAPKDLILEEEIYDKGKLLQRLSHEYDIARAIHKVTQKDAQNNVESIKIYNLFNDGFIKEIKIN